MAASLRELERQVQNIQQELLAIEELRKTDTLQQEQVDTLTNVVDRVSLVVLGDENLGVKGLVKTVAELKEESMSTKLSKAKWAGVGIVLLVIARGLWEAGVALLSK